MLLLQDNARPHVATVITSLAALRANNRGTSATQPRSSFEWPSGHKFAGDEDVKTAVTRWFISGCTEFYEAGINKLAPRLDKCLNLGRNFVEN